MGFVRSEASLDGLWIPMALVNIWRIPLLFAISGMGVAFAFAGSLLLFEVLRRCGPLRVLFGMKRSG